MRDLASPSLGCRRLTARRLCLGPPYSSAHHGQPPPPPSSFATLFKERRSPPSPLLFSRPHSLSLSTPPKNQAHPRTLDFVQATPPTASTGESCPEPLHSRLATPLLTPYSSSRHRSRRSRMSFLGAPPPPRTTPAAGLLRCLPATPLSR
jgi:hypothetical protein